MPKQPESATRVPIVPKFGKSSSSSSLKTSTQSRTEQRKCVRKVSEEQKELLVTLITYKNYTMIDAARAVKVSYSTAKKVFTRFRRSIKESLKKKVPSKSCKVRAGYVCVRSDDLAAVRRVAISSMIAGAEQPENPNID